MKLMMKGNGMKEKYLSEDSVMKQGIEKRNKRKGSRKTEKGAARRSGCMD
jgi:hypothetical protein